MYNVYSSNLTAIAYPFAAIPVRIAIENRDWELAANISPHDSEIDWANYPWQNSIFHFSRAIGSIHLGNIETAENELEILEELSEDIIKEGNAFKMQQIKIHLNQIQGLISFSKGNQAEGIALAREAAEMEEIIGVHGVSPSKVIPAREFLADMLMGMNEPEKALDAYEQNLKSSPNRFNGIYGAATAALQSGNTEKALEYYNALLILADNSNNDRPELLEAKEFVENTSL